MAKVETMDFDYKVAAYMAMKEAREFKRASEIAFDNNLSFPNMVNGAFACELYLKAYLIWTTKSNVVIKKHQLSELFGMLDAEAQERIRKDTQINYWDTFLKDSSDAFRQWRYYFEKDSVLLGHVGELHRMAEALDVLCSEVVLLKEII